MSKDAVSATISIVHFPGLKLRAGTWLQMLSMGGEPICEVEFAAALHGKSIFVALPEGKTGSGLQTGNRYLLRGFNGTSEFSFATHVLKVEEKPFIYAHLAYPDSVNLKVVRDEPRVKVSIPVLVISADEGRRIPGTMRDLNIFGTLVESSVPLGGVGESVSIVFSTQYEDRVVELKISGFVRHMHDVGGVFKSGLEFGQISHNDKLILYYILFTLAENE